MSDNQPSAAEPKPRPVAVVDIGATSIRMVIAEIDAKGGIRTLESLQHAVRLGKDTFTKGRIQQSTMEECVGILKGFRNVMQTYGITSEDQIRAVATSSVREAENRDAFLDRVYVATHIDVEAIEEAEVTRLNYAAVKDLLEKENDLKGSDAFIVEVGGGTTELLLVQQGHVTYSNTYGIGALRMRETLSTYRAPANRLVAVLDREIRRAVDDVRRSIPARDVPFLIAMSGDARFAASQLASDWEHSSLARVGVRPFMSFTKKVAPLAVDELVRGYKLAYQDAETLGPSLLVYAQLARIFKTKQILVPKSSLRDGLLHEMAAREFWTEEFAAQVTHSALTLGRRCRCDEEHGKHVAMIAMLLFHELQPEHQLDKRYELLLHVAALLHEIGMFISTRSYHKHSMYVLMHSDLFGLTRDDMRLIAQVARYQRRAAPRAYHEEYTALDRESRIVVSKLAAILRVADALDASDRQLWKQFSFARDRGQFIVTVQDADDLTLERVALRQKGTMFEDVYGMKAALREGQTLKT